MADTSYFDIIKTSVNDGMYSIVKQYCTDRCNKYGDNGQACKHCKYRDLTDNKLMICMFDCMPCCW